MKYKTTIGIMKEQLIFVAAIVLVGWVIAKCADALLCVDVAEMLDNDYEKQWEKEIMTKEQEAQKAQQKENIIWLMNQRP